MGLDHPPPLGYTRPRSCKELHLRVLVTGASGLLGGALTGELACRGHAVLAMIGRRPVALPEPFEAAPSETPLHRPWHGSAPPSGQIRTLAADLRLDRFGLNPARLDALTDGLDVIVHCAALTAFDRPLASHRAVNVEGTARILALADRPGAAPVPLLHVSTAYVCGDRSGLVAEAPFRPGAAFANAYEASKAEAETLVAAAGARGLPVAIARPSIVVGAWADGAIARFDNFYGMLRLVAEGRIRTIPAARGASLDLVPIDHVVRGLADIAERMRDAAGRIYHLVSGNPVPVTLLRDLALSYPQFHAPRFVPPEGFDPAALAEEEAWWHTQVASHYASYFRRAPRFADDNLRALTGEACPPVDWAFLCRLVDRCIAAGFLRPEVAQRTSG